MYYRVAIQVEPSPLWQWKSTVLSSLDALFQYLRLHRALPQDRLRVFSCSSREEMNEQLRQENLGLGSLSVTAALFLQKRLIHAPELTRGTQEREGGEYPQRASIAIATQPVVYEISRGRNDLVGGGMSALERRRLELEPGPGGDHDVPYSFAMPPSMPQVHAWMRLLAKVQRGELQP